MAPVSTLVVVTFASGTAAFVASVTVPETLPVLVWAFTGAVSSVVVSTRTAAARENTYLVFMSFLLERGKRPAVTSQTLVRAGRWHGMNEFERADPRSNYICCN